MFNFSLAKYFIRRNRKSLNPFYSLTLLILSSLFISIPLLKAAEKPLLGLNQGFITDLLPPLPPPLILAGGGADPSGGEGQQSTDADFSEAMNLAFQKLPFIFWRMDFFFRSSESEDQKVVQNIQFLSECYKEENTQCKNWIFQQIFNVQNRFLESPHFEKNDCPAKNIDHTTVDMSIDSNLNLCVSLKLLRYPDRTLEIQLISLLGHEIVHALGFEEKKAVLVQNWILENPGISFPSKRIKSFLLKEGDRFSLTLRQLSRDLGENLPIDPNRNCLSLTQLYTGFMDLSYIIDGIDTLSSNNELSQNELEQRGLFIKVPQNPILNKLKKISNQIAGLAFNVCTRKKEDKIQDPSAILQELLYVTIHIEELRQDFIEYTKNHREQSLFPMIPNSKSLLTLLLAIKEQLNSNSNIKNIQCQITGEKKVDLPLESQLPNNKTSILSLDKTMKKTSNQKSLPEIHLTSERINKNGGVGILLEFKTNNSKIQSDSFKVKIISTEGFQQGVSEVIQEDPVILSVIGKEKTFRTQFSLVSNSTTSDSITKELNFEIICQP